MILERIKKETQEYHEKLECSPLMASIGSRTVSLQEYLTILSKFYGFFKPLEASVSAVEQIEEFLPDFSMRRKAVSLEKDLADLGQHISDCALCSDLPPVAGLSDAFGVLYVMEGSTLGGRVISKILKDRLEVDPLKGGSFFHGYGNLTGERWSIFRQALLSYAAQSREEDRIIGTAHMTFRKLYEWINQ